MCKIQEDDYTTINILWMTRDIHVSASLDLLSLWCLEEDGYVNEPVIMYK